MKYRILFINIGFFLVCCSSRYKKTILMPVTSNDTIFVKDLRLTDSIMLSYTLKNINTENVYINSFSTTCGCTQINSKKDTLLPFEEKKYFINFYPSFVGKSGSYIRGVGIYCNSDTPVKQIFIKGKIIN